MEENTPKTSEEEQKVDKNNEQKQIETRRSKRLSIQPINQIELPLKTELALPKSPIITQVKTEVTPSLKTEVSDELKSSNKPSKLKWKLGNCLEARDVAKNWYKSKVVEVDESQNRVKVHFFGWNSRYDQWFDANSSDLRQSRTSSKLESKTKDESQTKQMFEIGKTIMAKWTDETYYPAKITKFMIKNEDGHYEVKFFDGVRRTLRFNLIRDISDEEKKIFLADKQVNKQYVKVNNDISDQKEDVNTDLNESLVKNEQKEEEEIKRRAEAELLLAIQQPVLKQNEDENTIEEKLEKIIKAEEPNSQETKLDEDKNTPSIRKSLRVKRLRTFTEEIVFDSPSSSITYNLASVHKVKPIEPNPAKKKKEDIKKDEVEKEDKKKTDTTNVQNYFKSLKFYKSTSNKKGLNLNLNKLINKKPVKMKTVEKLNLNENDNEIEIDEIQKKKKKKKLKKDKKKLFEQLIANSKLQLEQQQKLIAKQLEEHEYKKLQKILKKQKKQEEELNNKEQKTVEISNQFQQMNQISNEPISCTVQDCTKTFRKQSLLDYHLKYHHYLQNNINQTPKQFKKVTEKKEVKTKPVKVEEEPDPYEVIHCRCGSHINKGFMIQCEICLCWQHGECMNIPSGNDVPENYLCWICNEPSNKLKKLKYQNWMNSRLEKEVNKSGEDSEEAQRLKMLNECSKQYYNLNLLMYTLEYQMSLFTQMTTIKSKPDQSVEANGNNNNDLDLDDEQFDQLDKLAQNISHLQSCLSKKFAEFNSKLDEYETNYQLDENGTDLEEFNLEQLYNQIQSII